MHVIALFNKENVYKLLNLELFMLYLNINRAQNCGIYLEKVTNQTKIV